ncbi:MAG: hypothetical protein H0U23_17695 [Blastocatellia bacterium]|nr:hypothetical protein [Blastocatellia bacterium]
MPQENNMAEVLRLLKTVIVKVDDLAADMKDVKGDVRVLKTDVAVLKTDVRDLRTGLNRLDAKVDLLTGRFEDVAVVVIKDTQRTSVLEVRVDTLEGKAN